jgi:D-lactate dehydrogenase (cytochrome)
MLIGSEGTLAGIAEVEVRLTTRPKNRLYFTQFFDSVDTAFDFATSVQRIGLSILALEFVDQNSIKIISNCAARQSCKTIQSIKPNDSAAVFLDITYDNPSDLEDIYEKLQTELDSFGVDTSRSLAGTEDRDLQDFKVFRHAIPENINALVASRKKNMPSLYKISTDMSVNPEKLKEIFDFYNMTLSQMKIDHFIFGHFGDAHLHLNVVPNSLEQLNKFQSIYAEFAKKVVQCGGAVAGEHGIGRVKKHFLPIQYNSEELEQLKLIKSFFDPNWLLNPGVLIDR